MPLKKARILSLKEAGILSLKEARILSFGKIRISAAFAALLLWMSAAAEGVPRMVVPGGQSVGVSLNYGGAYVDDLGDIETADGLEVSPAAEAGIKKGDIITELNGDEVGSVDEFTKRLNRLSDGEEAELTVKDSGGSREVSLVPVRGLDGRLKIGAWIMDAASGVGTITYYDPASGGFAAVGHSITGVESMDGGDIYKADIVGIRRGEAGAPGELIGVYSENRRKIGEITSGGSRGVSGIVSNPENLISVRQPVPVGSKDDVHKGDAIICSNIEGGDIGEYSIEITEVNKDDNEGKNIIFRVTDRELIAKTGGIVRGMSGSPIIQDGKLIGSVTHVLVKEPETGYGVFAEIMDQ